MNLKWIDGELTICKVPDLSQANILAPWFFLARTDQELSLVCLAKDLPANHTQAETGWRAFRIEGELDFSLTGILSRLSSILAANRIGIFAISTFNTDYILVKAENLVAAQAVLSESGYAFIE